MYSNSDERIFKDYEEFQKLDNQESHRNLTWKSGEVFSKLIYNMDGDFRKDWPEYKFLAKYKFVNDKLQFLDKDGKVVDFDGNPVKEDVVVEEKDVEAEFLEG